MEYWRQLTKKENEQLNDEDMVTYFKSTRTKLLIKKSNIRSIMEMAVRKKRKTFNRHVSSLPLSLGSDWFDIALHLPLSSASLSFGCIFCNYIPIFKATRPTNWYQCFSF